MIAGRLSHGGQEAGEGAGHDENQGPLIAAGSSAIDHGFWQHLH